MGEDEEFCHRCGATKKHAVILDLGDRMDCPNCGAEIQPDSDFCASCGSRIIKAEIVNRYSDTRLIAGILLAFIPGLFNVFGLGHIILGKYLKGIIFIISSVICLYLQFFYHMTETENYVFLFGTLALYFVQVYDIYRTAYAK